MNSLIFFNIYMNLQSFFYNIEILSFEFFDIYGYINSRLITRKLFENNLKFCYENIPKIRKFWWITKNEILNVRKFEKNSCGLKNVKKFILNKNWNFNYFANFLIIFRHYFYAKSMFLTFLIWMISLDFCLKIWLEMYMSYILNLPYTLEWNWDNNLNSDIKHTKDIKFSQ